MCSTEFPPDSGGIGIYMYELAKGLHHAGWLVEMVTLQQFSTPETITAFNTVQPFPITQMQSRKDGASIRQIARRFKPDLIVGTDLPCTWLAWQAAVLHRIPLVAIAIGSEFRHSRFPRYQMKQLVYNTCLQVVSISQFTADLMHSVGINPRRESIIYPGGDEVLHRPDVDSAFLRDRYALHGKRIILTMGSLSSRKGQDVVIQAMPKILQQHPHAHYLIAGRDRTDGEFLALVNKMGLQDSVTFAGMIPNEEKSAYYNLVDVCAITSRNTHVDVEGYGIVVIEAALCRRTSVGTTGTGTAEAIVDGKTGLLVPQDDPSATAKVINQLLGDDDLRHKLQSQAYDRASNDCTWSARMQEFDALFRQLVAKDYPPRTRS